MATKTKILKRPKGMLPEAFDYYFRAFRAAGVEPLRIVQTASGALGKPVAASAGTHDPDGMIPGTKEPYSVCVDLSVWRVRGVARWEAPSIRWFLYNLARQRFVAWYRHGPKWKGNFHVHAIYVAAPMKESCMIQVVDFLNDRNGLQGHGKETFWTASQEWDAQLKREFLLHNPSAKRYF